MSQRHTIEVPRTARYHVLGAGGPTCREVWFLLHGYAQLAEGFLASCAALARPERLLVAPEALSRFYLKRGTGEVGASWMTREERAGEIHDNLRYLDLLWEHVREGQAFPNDTPLLAFGFSQGGAAAARWAVLGRSRVAHVILWGCPLPPDLELGARGGAQRLRWTFVLGDDDTAIDRVAWEAEIARLRSTGIEPECLRFAGGHAIDAATLGRLER